MTPPPRPQFVPADHAWLDDEAGRGGGAIVPTAAGGFCLFSATCGILLLTAVG